MLFEFNAFVETIVKAYILLESVLSGLKGVAIVLLALIVLVSSLCPVLEVFVTLVVLPVPFSIVLSSPSWIVTSELCVWLHKVCILSLIVSRPSVMLVLIICLVSPS